VPKGYVLNKSKIEAPVELSENIARPNAALPIVMREFQHRVANTLEVLNSSLRQELVRFRVPGLKEALRRHEQQVVAIADLHRFFGRYPDAVQIPAEDYFQPLCALLSKSILAPLGLHCEVSVDRTPMRAEKSELLGLAIAELVLNAAKHAFTGRVSGCVRIELLAQEACWCCIISDNGIGMQNGTLGSGSKIIESLVDALGGRLGIRGGPAGTAVSITFIDQEGQPRI